MDKTPFEREIYAKADNPYASWLDAATEKALFEEWLRQNIASLRFAGRDKTVSILDLGCSSGSTSLRLMRVLREHGIEFTYTGVDPYEEQLERFKRLARGNHLPTPHLCVGDVESYIPDRVHDLVLASHLLYYTSDMQIAVDRILAAGKEAIIVHHGSRGINTFHEYFRDEVKAGRHIISTDNDVATCLRESDLGGRVVRHDQFPSTLDVSSCLDPTSQRGQNLLSFFFERTHETIEPETLQKARSFLTDTYAPTYQMTHDVGIFVVS